MKPKKIVLATFGSRGDVQPMLALTLALQGEGHDVLLAGPPEKKAWARELGCPFHPLGSDVTAFLDGMKNAHSPLSAFSFIKYLRGELVPQFYALRNILSGADLAVGASLAFTMSTVAESMGIAYRYVAFTPQLLPSGHHPFLAFKRQNLPAWMNRLGWRIARDLDRFNLKAILDRLRRKLGLKPLLDPWRHILGPRVILASDPAIAGVAPDVEVDFVQTGYFHLRQPDVQLPELEAFLSRGSPPVYAGFGSMPKRDQAAIVPDIIRAARSQGQRLVINRFWDDPSNTPESEDLFFIRRYPHLKLFPRMAAVIHHGGAGTTACAAISSVPQIIVPHALDQYYWGNQVHRSCLGPEPIWRSRLTVPKLSSAIQECMVNQQIREMVENRARRIIPKRSIETAVSEISKRLSQAS